MVQQVWHSAVTEQNETDFINFFTFFEEKKYRRGSMVYSMGRGRRRETKVRVRTEVLTVITVITPH